MIVLLVARFPDLRRPSVFVLGLLALLAVTMLLYTVTAVFIGLLLVGLFIGLAWRGGPDERRQLLPSRWPPWSVYGHRLRRLLCPVRRPAPVLDPPRLPQRPRPGRVPRHRARPLLYAWKISRLAYYGVLGFLLLAPIGLWSLLRGAHNRLACLLAAWFAVFALFFVAGSRIDMVDKEVWLILPAVAICAGLACDTLLRRWNPARLTTVATGLDLAHLTWAGLSSWYVRTHPSTRH